MSIEILLIPIAISVSGAIAQRKSQKTKTANSFCLETLFKDKDTLQSALKNYGCKSVVMSDRMEITSNGSKIEFELNENGVFDAVFSGNIPIEEANKFLSELHEEYTRLVQQQVYQKLKSRATAQGLVLEYEELQDDNSVLLSFRVNN